MRARRGSTLVELLVTLVIMAIVASVATLALRPGTSRAPSNYDRIAAARRTAVSQRRSATIEIVLGGSVHAMTAFPDGRVVADPVLQLNPLSGEPERASR